MNELRKAAQQALAAMESGPDVDPIFAGETIAALRAALAQPEKTNQCAETCERAKLCAVCASVVDDVKPEPVAKVELMTTGGNAGLATRILEIDDHLRERLRPGQLLYNSPPQRKPLTEVEIYKMFGWYAMSFVRAVERAHGIGG